MSTHVNRDVGILQQLRLLRMRMQRGYRHWFYDDLSDASPSMALDEIQLPQLVTLTMAILSGATGAFLLWAGLTQVKELARTEGQVLPSGYNQLVQHLEGGLVREILVHEGDFVQKNQVLMRLDGAGLEEDFQEQKALVESLALQAERLRAQVDGRDPNFSQIKASKEMAAEQKRMFDSTKESQASEHAVLVEQIAQKQKIIARLKESLGYSQRNLKVVKESKDIYAGLSKDGLTTRTTFLKKQQELNSQQAEVHAISGQIEEAKKELSEFERRKAALTSQQRDEAYMELHRVESELARSLETLKKRNDRVSRLEVRAPVVGYIKGLKLNTIGSVIPAGQTLMEIVPVDEQLIVEARILPQQIGRVEVGQEVQVKVDSYDYVRFGTIPATLESISAMTFTDESVRQDYYKGRIKLSRNYAGSMPTEHKLMPGMTVDADIVTGEKSVLGYLLKPIQVALNNAMTEK